MFTGVGNKSPKFLSDLERWEANLRVICRRCRRSGDFDAGETARFFAAMGWSINIAILALLTIGFALSLVPSRGARRDGPARAAGE